MAALARDLASIETDEPMDPESFERTIAAADRDRARRGVKPLERHESHPEEELYRRARALGLRRPRG